MDPPEQHRVLMREGRSRLPRNLGFPRLSLRAHLVVLVVVILLPMVGFAVFVGGRLLDHDQSAMEQGLLDHVEGLARAVDQDLLTSMAALDVLADSDALTRGDLGAFSARLARARAARGWVSAFLITPDGMQALHVGSTPRTETVFLGDREFFVRVMASRQPFVSNLTLGPAMGVPCVAIAVPVLRGGAITHVLGAALGTDRLNAVLAADGGPDWVRGIVDRNGTIVARTREPERYVGQQAASDFIRAIGTSANGLYTATTVEGRQVRGAYSRASLSGWTIGVGIPVEDLPRPTHTAIVRLGLPGLSLLLLSVGLAVLLARRIARPISAASEAASQLTTGAAVTTVRSSVRELAQLGEALEESSALLTKREQRLRLLSETAAMLLSSPRPASVVRLAFDRLTRDLQLDVYLSFLVNEHGRSLRLDSFAGIDRDAVPTFEHLKFGEAVSGTVAETRSPIVVERALASRDPKHAMIRSVGLDAYASFPLVADGELIGVVSFGTRTRDAFAPEEIAILQTIASYCAIALQRRRLLETLEREVAERGHAAARGEQAAVRARRAVARLQRLHAITEAALVDVPLPELLGNLLPQIRSALAADNATVLLLSPDGDALTPVASDGLLEEVKAAVRVPLGDGVAGRIAVSAAGMIFDDLSQVDVKSPLLAERVTSLAGVPLHAGDELIGVLHVGAARARVFTGEDLDFLRVVADSAALAIERVRLRGFERAARAEAEAASRAKDEFLAMLGHELRNPLGAIRTASALLDRIGSNERKAVLARDVIARQVRHLARLVDDLLDVARVMRGKIAMERRPLDLAAAVQRHLDVLRADGRLELHRLETRLDSVMIDADPVRLDQVVGNLLTNALKYTPPGGTITITVCRDPDAGVLRVADTGIGIAADLLPQIFDLFVQSERALDRSQGGLGVGLTLVRRLVVAHGGRVEAESEGPGRGAKFTVWWPLAIRGASRPPDGEPPPTRAGTIKRIVVVEDNTDSRQMFVELLEAAGHEVYWAEDGRPALDLLRRIQADVAFIDIGLPGLDGYEVARRLRAEPGGRKTMLVAVTGYGQAEDRERALAAGFDAHLVKPVDPAALEAVLLDANRT